MDYRGEKTVFNCITIFIIAGPKMNGLNNLMLLKKRLIEEQDQLLLAECCALVA